MIIKATTELLRIAEGLELKAKQIRLQVARIQKESAPKGSDEMYKLIEEINKRRDEVGEAPIIPLITDGF